MGMVPERRVVTMRALSFPLRPVSESSGVSVTRAAVDSVTATRTIVPACASPLASMSARMLEERARCRTTREKNVLVSIIDSPVSAMGGLGFDATKGVEVTQGAYTLRGFGLQEPQLSELHPRLRRNLCSETQRGTHSFERLRLGANRLVSRCRPECQRARFYTRSRCLRSEDGHIHGLRRCLWTTGRQCREGHSHHRG